METPPEKFHAAPFAVHVTRGVIRDRKVRRVTILILLAVAILMLVAGSTFLNAFLNPREHGWRFAIFWLACAWLTFTALLLGLFDLLAVRADERAARRVLREKIARGDPVE